MPTFHWEGLSGRGRRLAGQVRAASREAALAQLRARGVLPSSARIVEARPGVGWLAGRQRVRGRDVALLSRQLAAMLDAGLPLAEALGILAAQSPRPQVRVLLEQTRQDIEAGVSLAKALGRHPAAFGPMFIAMIGVGESAGVLDRVLVRLADHTDKALALREKVMRALLYPAAVMVVAVSVTVALLLFVIPVFAELFAGLGQALPLPTRVVIAASEATAAYGLYAGGVVLVAVGVVARLCGRPAGRRWFDAALLRLPLLRTLVAKAAVARVTACLAMLLAAGVAILEALAIAAETAGNSVVEGSVLAARTAVEAGRPLAEPLWASGIFEPLVCQMIAVGERTGTLDTMLGRAAAFCEEEVDRVVASTLALLEPAIMVVLGIVMGGLVISMYLPVFRLGNVM